MGSGASWASTDTVAYTYDHADQLASVTDFNGHTSSYTTSADGLATAMTLGASGDTVSTSYAANDVSSSITLSNGSTLQQFSYSDAPSGGIVSETDLPSSSLSPAVYTYNAQSQVTQDVPGSGSAKSYTLDASGNLTTLPTGASGTYNAASQVTSSTLSGTTTSYTYDAAGNQTGQSVGGTATVTATYNGANQLTSYNNPLANLSSATYNGLGLRTAVAVTPSGGSLISNTFLWNSNTSVPQLLQDSSNAYIYGISRTAFEQVNLSTGAITYHNADALGSVRGVVSSMGTLIASTSYDAWGNAQSGGGLAAYTSFGFAGGYRGSTGLYYLINRYYDSTAGQFISMDPIVMLTGQAYSYTGGNSVNGVDPLGLWPNWHSVANAFDITRHTFAAAADYPANQIIGAGYSIYASYNQIYQDGASGCSFFSIATTEDVGRALFADASAALLAEGEGEVAAEEGAVDVSATTPVGRSGATELNVTSPNAAGQVDGVAYSGHAFDQMQARGIVPSAVKDAINYGAEFAGADGTTVYYSSVNNLSVVLNGEGTVVTTSWGLFKPR